MYPEFCEHEDALLVGDTATHPMAQPWGGTGGVARRCRGAACGLLAPGHCPPWLHPRARSNAVSRMILSGMKKTDCVWLGRALLPSLGCWLPMKAYAGPGLAVAEALATAQWVVLALIFLVMSVVVGVLLYVGARWLRPQQPRLRFVRALAYGALVMFFLILVGSYSFLFVSIVSGGVLGVLLYVVVPWFKPHQPRLRFVRALAYGVVMGAIMTYVLVGA